MSHESFITGLHVLLVIAGLHVYQVSCRVSLVTISGNPTVDENRDITYTCTATACNVSCTYLWFTDLSSTLFGNKLIATNVKRKTGGKKYSVTCIAKDRTPFSKSSSVKQLDVYYGPDSVTIAPGTTLTMQEGMSYASVQCSAVSCYPACSVTWKKDKATVAEQGTLFHSLDVASRDQAGNYECIATNTRKATPTSKSENFSLTITYPPNVTASWDGSTSTLTCRADGVPTSYEFGKWGHAFNNVNIRDIIGSQSGNKLTYKFSTISYQDRGMYTCIVSNGIVALDRSDSWIGGTIDVDPNDKPKLVSYLESLNVSKGASLSIELEIYAYPAIGGNDVTLRDNSSESIRGGNVEIGITSTTLSVEFHSKSIPVTGQKVTATIETVLEEYFGNLHINIRNGFGDTSCDITLYPEGPPDPPLDLHVSGTGHDTVTLTFRSGFFNGGSQTFVVEYSTGAQGAQWVNGSSVFAGEEKNLSLSVVINGLTPEMFYMFRAYGYNIYDRSEYADILVNATTLEAPLALGAIIGGTIGGVSGVVSFIVVVIVIYRWRRKNKKDHAARYSERVTAGGDKGVWDSRPAPGKDNPVYMTEEPDYENTTIKNCGTAKPRAAEDVNLSKWQHTETVDCMDVYLELETGDSAQVEEAYVTKEALQDKDKKLLEEEPYLDMEALHALRTPSALGTPRMLKHTIDKTPAYWKVSKQQDTVTDEGDDDRESIYLDMEATQTPKTKAKNGVSHAPKGYMYATANVSLSIEEPYMSMDCKNGRPVPPKRKLKGKGKCQNVPMREKVKRDPDVSLDQDLYMSMSTKKDSRDSIPSYIAPPPPLPVPQEDDYMNIKLG